MATDQFCLRWNNFQINITSALESLKCDEDLVDVTLTCEGQNVKAHKVILSACSPYFRNVFKENPCSHPVVILKDVRYEDVTALLNFMYLGEVYITQDRLAPFLHTAELLQVRGLAGATNPFKETVQQQPQPPPPIPHSKQSHSLKAKKSISSVPRHLSPPLSLSPISQSNSNRTSPLPIFRHSKTPLIPGIIKDTHSPFQDKERPLPAHRLVSREQDTGFSKCIGNSLKSSNTSGDVDNLSVPINQQLHSGVPNPAYAHISDNVSQTLSPMLQIPPHTSESHLQPMSPQPVKRRKAFPRRLSSGSTHPPPEDLSMSPGSGNEQLRTSLSSDEHPPEDERKDDLCIVKQEPVEDEDLESIPENGESCDKTSKDASRVGSPSSIDMDVPENYSQVGSESEGTLSLDRDIKEESSGENLGEVNNQSVLLRSLAGAAPVSQQTEDVSRAAIPFSSTQRSSWRCMQPQTCGICFRIFSNSVNLKQHIENVHMPSQRIMCNLCKKSFKNKRYRRKHLVKSHGVPLKRSKVFSPQTFIY